MTEWLVFYDADRPDFAAKAVRVADVGRVSGYADDEAGCEIVLRDGTVHAACEQLAVILDRLTGKRDPLEVIATVGEEVERG